MFYVGEDCDTCCDDDESCTIFSSALATDSGFTQNAGTWSAGGGGVQCSDSYGLLSCDTEHPEGSTGWSAASVTVKLTHDFDRARICLSHLDKDNELALEVAMSNGTIQTGVVRVVKVEAGVSTFIGDDVPLRFIVKNRWIRLRMFWKYSYADLRCEVSDAEATSGRAVAFRRSGAVIPGATKAAVECILNSGTATFKSFSYNRHFSHADFCPPSCVIHQEIADTATLPTDLVEWDVTGEWDIAPGGGIEAITSSGGGGTFCISKIPDFLVTNTPEDTVNGGFPRHNYKLSVTKGAVVGADQAYGIIFDYLDSENYHLLKWFLDTSSGESSPSLHRELYKVTGGVEALIYDFGYDSDPSSQVVICVDNPDGAHYVSVGKISLATTLHGGARFGFWANGLTNAHFYSYTYELQARTGNEPDRPCTTCREYCSICTTGSFNSDELAITISGLSGTIGDGCGADGEQFNQTYVAGNCAGTYSGFGTTVQDPTDPTKKIVTKDDGHGGSICEEDQECRFVYFDTFDCTDGVRFNQWYTLQIYFTVDVGGVAVTVELNFNATSEFLGYGKIVWYLFIAQEKIDCSALDGLEIPLQSDTSNLNVAGSVVTISM